jgi:hypothetical protein
VTLPKSLALDPDNAQALCEYAEAIKVDPNCPRASIVGVAQRLQALALGAGRARRAERQADPEGPEAGCRVPEAVAAAASPVAGAPPRAVSGSRHPAFE